MSKRSGAVPEETKKRILAAAEEEFSLRGLQGSSLRRICSAAGVTTGALYFFFEGKDDLFRTLISQVTEPFSELMARHYEAERGSEERDSEKGAEADFQAAELLINLYFGKQQIWDIIINNLSYPAVREFFDKFTDLSTEHYLWLLSGASQRSIDPFAVHQFVHMQLDTILTLISHGFNREEMLIHAKTAVKMLRGAFRALLQE